ncbi:MAG: extracellular solute-binding protein [Actinomycetota bacterium]
MRRRIATIAAVLAGLLAAGCAEATERSATPQLVVVETGGIQLDPGVIETFEADRDVVVVVAREDDPARSLQDLAAAPDSPTADVLIGLPDAIAQDRPDVAFAEIAPAGVERLPPGLLDGIPTGAVPISIRDLCVLFDRATVDAGEIEAPRTFEELIGEAWAGRLVIPDPATTLEGRLLLDALRQAAPDDAAPSWLDIAASMQRNGTVVAPTWREGFDTEFVSLARPDGPPLVWGAAGMPAAMVAFEAELPSAPTLGVVPTTCIRSTALAALPVGADQPRLAVEFVEHLLTPEVQVTLVDAVGSLPARRDVPLPDAWSRFALRINGPLRPTPRPPEEPPLSSVWTALGDGTLTAPSEAPDEQAGE